MCDEIWEPLAEITLYYSSDQESIYCLCTRSFLRNEVNEEEILLDPEKLDTPEEAIPEIFSKNPEHQLEPLPALKKNEVEAASCYCSASHYSTDDYESVMQASLDLHHHREVSLCPLQNSDSGADLSEHFADRQYPCIDEEPCHYEQLDEAKAIRFESPGNDVLALGPSLSTLHSEPVIDYPENWTCAGSTKTELCYEWERHWAKHGEAIIWKSWIQHYGKFINPVYVEPVHEGRKESSTKEIPELKVSFSDEGGEEEKRVRTDSVGSGSGYERLRFGLRSRCSNNSISGKSVANTTVTTDSMTNVTKITVSSLDFSADESQSSSSQLLSTSSDPSSRSSSSESSQEDPCPENDVIWRKLWKEHYDQIFTENYQTFEEGYLASHDQSQAEKTYDEKLEEAKAKLIQKFCGEPAIEVPKSSEGDDEVSDDKENRQLNEFGASPQRKKKNFQSRSYYNSVGYILKMLNETSISNDAENTPEPVDGSTGSEQREKGNSVEVGAPFQGKRSSSSHSQVSRAGAKRSLPNDDEDDEEFSPKRTVTELRAHASTPIERKPKKDLETVKRAMTLVQLPFEVPENALLSHGHVHYRKRNIRAQNRRLKLLNYEPRQRTHLFFDDEGEVARTDLTPLTPPIDDADRPSVHLINEGYEAHSSSADDTQPASDNLENSGRKQKKKKKKMKKPASGEHLPPEIAENRTLIKYWRKRRNLFSKYDEGIKMDAESWFSVTPEKLAAYQADRCQCDVIIDAFCGAGGNAIQFAFTCERVIAIDIDERKIAMARHNAEIYGVADRIEFIVGDFTVLAPTLSADVVFLSPPWGGPEYQNQASFPAAGLLPPYGAAGLLECAHKITEDVAFFLPRNINTYEISLLAGPGGEVEIEQNFLDTWLIGATAFFGGLIQYPDESPE